MEGISLSTVLEETPSLSETAATVVVSDSISIRIFMISL